MKASQASRWACSELKSCSRPSSEDLPESDQSRARLDAGRAEHGLFVSVADCRGDLPKAAFSLLRQTAECLHLHLICEGPDQELPPEELRRGPAVKGEPALPQFEEIEIAQTRDLVFQCGRIDLRPSHGIHAVFRGDDRLGMPMMR